LFWFLFSVAAGWSERLHVSVLDLCGLPPFVDCRMVGRVTLNDALRFISGRMMHVAFEEQLGDNLLDDDPTNPPGF
jgi:hypothetical protein